MKSLMTTTALVATVSAGAALAQSMDNPFVYEGAATTDLRASDLIGMRVYAAEPAADGSEWSMTEAAGLDSNWEDVGEINDLVVARDGTVASVLVDIGGFLGIGERHVAMDMEDIRFVADSGTEDADDFFLVIPAAMADFEAAPAYETAAREKPMTEATAMSKDASAKDDVAYHETPMTIDEVAALTAEDLIGARVYDASGDWIGEVGHLTMSDNGQVKGAVIDVGGFLGLGEKPVELPIQDVQINRHSDSEGFRVSVPMTEEELEALPTWQES